MPHESLQDSAIHAEGSAFPDFIGEVTFRISVSECENGNVRWREGVKGIPGKSTRGWRWVADEALEAGHPMIELTRLNGNKFSINSDTIKYIEATPDTTISLTTGEKILVAETCETVVNRCIEHRAKVLRLAWPDARMFLGGKVAEGPGGDAARAALASSSNS